MILRKLEKPVPPGRQPVKLNSVKSGELVRFTEASFEQALEENAFYIVTENPSGPKDGRIYLTPLDGKTPVLRDGDRFVFTHGWEAVIAEDEAKV